jgi:hypothetical protein
MSVARGIEKDTKSLGKTVESWQSEGLCMTCEHTHTCAFKKASSQPVVFCEEFVEGVGSDEASATAVRTRSTHFQVDYNLKGLCMNCEHHGDCVHEKPFGGVWHCENYS